MARSEKRNKARQTQLLGDGRPGVSGNTSLHRNKRKEAATTVQKAKRGKTKDTPTKGKTSTTIEDSDGGTSQRKGYRQSNKDRQPNRGAEGEDRTLRRSASELGIEWVGSYCPDEQPHYFIASFNLDGGNFFKCKRCLKYIWLPASITEATILGRLIDHIGTTNGYHKYLDKHQGVKVMVAKLQDLWYARQKISDDEEFVKLVTSVMEDKEYDRIR